MMDEQKPSKRKCPLCLQPANGHSDCLDYVDDILERASEHCQVCKEVRDILFTHAKRRHDQLMSLAKKPIKRVPIEESFYPLPGFVLSKDGKYYVREKPCTTESSCQKHQMHVDDREQKHDQAQHDEKEHGEENCRGPNA